LLEARHLDCTVTSKLVVNGSEEEMKALTDVLCKGKGDEDIKCKDYVEYFKNSWTKDDLFKVGYT